jgi:hypothetical protein
LFLLCGTVTSEPYSFSATVDRDSISVGDPLNLILTLELPTDAKPTVIPEISLPESFRIQGTQDAVRDPVGEGRSRWTQSIKLTGFRTGEFEIPGIRLKVSEVPGDTTVLSDDPIPILVQSIRPEDLADILDVKQPVSIDAVIPFWIWGLLVLLVALLVGYLIWRRRRKVQEFPIESTVVVDWFDEVRKLCFSGLIEAGEFDVYYTRLSEALRRFIEQRSGVEAMERTTFEIRSDLVQVGMADTHILGVESFLNEADLVKFAKFEPNGARAVEDGDRVLALMVGIEKARERREAMVEHLDDQKGEPSDPSG